MAMAIELVTPMAILWKKKSWKLYKKKKTITRDARNLHPWPSIGVKGSLRSGCDIDNLNFKSSTL